MADDRTTLQTDGTTMAPRGGFGLGNVLIGLGILALLAVLAFIVASANHDRALRTAAVTSAASSLAAEPPPAAPAR